MKRFPLLALPLCAAGLLLAAPPARPAHPPGGDAAADVPHVRAEATIGYYLNREASTITEEAVRKAFDAWQGETRFSFVYLGRGRAGLRRDGKNTVSFMAAWPKDLPPNDIGYCMNWYDGEGRIVESDIVMNMSRVGFTTTRTNMPGSYYIEGVLAHEIGHSIGLNHIEEPGCLMMGRSSSVESYGKGSIDRSSVEAYRALYPR